MIWYVLFFYKITGAEEVVPVEMISKVGNLLELR